MSILYTETHTVMTPMTAPQQPVTLAPQHHSFKEYLFTDIEMLAS